MKNDGVGEVSVFLEGRRRVKNNGMVEVPFFLEGRRRRRRVKNDGMGGYNEVPHPYRQYDVAQATDVKYFK